MQFTVTKETLCGLPCYHTMRDTEFSDISFCDQGYIKPTKCDVFNEDLIYLFYGRPAFRWDTPHSPIVFVFKTDARFQPVRIFPFDSGAYDNKLYGEEFCSKYKLTDYQLNICEEEIPSFIRRVWETNVNYYDGRKPDEAVYEENDIAERYQRFVYSREYGYADTRAFTLELQIGNPINMKECIQFAYVSRNMPDADRAKLRKYGIKTERYFFKGSINQVFKGILNEERNNLIRSEANSSCIV